MCEERLLGEAEVEDAADLGLDCLEPGGELRQLGEGLRGDEGVPGVIVTQQPVTPYLYRTVQYSTEYSTVPIQYRI